MSANLGDTSQVVIGPLPPATSLVDNFVMDAGTLVSSMTSLMNEELIPHIPNWALALGVAGGLMLWNNSGNKKHKLGF